MLTLLGINKVLAIYVGPTGYAALGQFQNAVQMITTFAGSAINTGVTKYTAEYREDQNKIRLLWRTAGTSAMFGGIIAGLLVYIFREPLSLYFLKESKYEDVFVWFSFTILFFIFNSLLLAILNGMKEIEAYVIANIAGSFFSLLVTVILSVLYGLMGALVALAIYQSLSFFITFYICWKKEWFKISFIFGKVDKVFFLNLLKYAAMALTSAACVPVSHILIRENLGSTLGWDYAGYWEGMWRLSGAYMLVFTTTLSVYFLPRFSEISCLKQLKAELTKGYFIIMPIFVVAVAVIYYFKIYIIHLLFTPEFNPIADMLGWQMLGDILKMASWIIGFIMHSKGFYKLFIFSEVAFSAFFYFISLYFVNEYGVQGMGISHAVNYIIYFIFISLSVGYLLNKTMSSNSNG